MFSKFAQPSNVQQLQQQVQFKRDWVSTLPIDSDTRDEILRGLYQMKWATTAEEPTSENPMDIEQPEQPEQVEITAPASAEVIVAPAAPEQKKKRKRTQRPPHQLCFCCRANKTDRCGRPSRVVMENKDKSITEAEIVALVTSNPQDPMLKCKTHNKRETEGHEVIICQQAIDEITNGGDDDSDSSSVVGSQEESAPKKAKTSEVAEVEASESAPEVSEPEPEQQSAPEYPFSVDDFRAIANDIALAGDECVLHQTDLPIDGQTLVYMNNDLKIGLSHDTLVEPTIDNLCLFRYNPGDIKLYFLNSLKEIIPEADSFIRCVQGKDWSDN
jgi:hypothetical protein